MNELLMFKKTLTFCGRVRGRGRRRRHRRRGEYNSPPYSSNSRAKKQRAITRDNSVGIKIPAFMHIYTSYPITVQSLKVIHQKL